MGEGLRRGLLLAAALACLLAAAQAGRTLSAQRESLADTAELTLFPSGRFLQELSLGHRHLVADIAWLTAIQYYGKHRLADRRYPLARQLFGVLTDADPGFLSAYLFGALVLAEAGTVREGERLLERGAASNPMSWRMHFELGFFRYVYLQAWRQAADAFAAAARLPGAPEHALRFAAASFERGGERGVAAALWELIARGSENEEIRQLARRRQLALDAAPCADDAAPGSAESGYVAGPVASPRRGER